MQYSYTISRCFTVVYQSAIITMSCSAIYPYRHIGGRGESLPKLLVVNWLFYLVCHLKHQRTCTFEIKVKYDDALGEIAFAGEG